MPIFITLLEDDSYRKQVTRDQCNRCGQLFEMLGDDVDVEEEKELPLSTITAPVMDKVLVFLERHATDPMQSFEMPIKTNVIEDLVGEWDVEYIKFAEEDHELLVALMLAANYLNCPQLLKLCVLKLACMVKDMELDKVKKTFHIPEDITPEEEKKVRDENEWIFDIGEEKQPRPDFAEVWLKQ